MKKSVYFFALFSLLFIACNKEPGRGGLASISGKVYEIRLDAFNNISSEGYVSEEDVYLIYGDADETYDADFSTSYDGSYRFDNLTPGNYTVFVYSDDTITGSKTHVEKTITISGKKDNIELGDITKYNK